MIVLRGGVTTVVSKKVNVIYSTNNCIYIVGVVLDVLDY